MQVYARKAYCAAFALPPWTCNAFLHLPLHACGVGCPSLPLRNPCLLTLTYLHVSVSRNPLSRASAAYLLTTHAPFSEGHALRTGLATLHARVHTQPFPHLHDMRVHAHIVSDLPLPSILWLVTDGALTGHRLGGGVVFFHPQLGVLHAFSFGIHVVAATSADAEWLAKLIPASSSGTGVAKPFCWQMPPRPCTARSPKPPPLPPFSTTSSAKWSRPLWEPMSSGYVRSTTRDTHTHVGHAQARSTPPRSTRGLPSATFHCPTPPPEQSGAGHQQGTTPPQCTTQHCAPA